MLFQDARDSQILVLAVFLFLGIGTRDWTLQPHLLGIVFLSCLLTQLCLSQFANFVKQKAEYNTTIYSLHPRSYSLWQFLSISSLKSALITALGLCLLLRGNDYQTMAIAGILAIASKFIFRFRGKHFFNPANFGIIAALTLTNDAWVSPGQWGTEGWYLLLFLGAGGLVLKQVGRWDTSVAFLLAYIGLEAIRNLWLGWSWDVLVHQLMSGSLLLFALFMLTDPRSIPNATMGRLIWAVSIAFLTFILQHLFYLPTAIFWALFFLSPLTIILDTIWLVPRFTWQFNRLKFFASEKITV